MGRGVGSAVDTALDRLVVPGYSRIGYAVRRHLPGWPADPAPDALVGRRVAVTGASSGLGEQLAAALVGLGAHVDLLVRNRERGRASAERIAAATGREETTLHLADISDLATMGRVAADLAGAAGHLDGIVHNAGALPATRTESPQGHELTMALHVLGPVLLTERLLPVLGGGRVVLVTSGGMYAQPLPVDDPDYESGDYAGATAYARSKRTQVELLPILQERWGRGDVAVHASHPGWAATPGVSESLPRFERLTRPILRGAAAGADTTTWLLASEPPPVGGRLWHDRRPRPTSYLSRTRPGDEDRAAMWRWVCAATGLQP